LYNLILNVENYDVKIINLNITISLDLKSITD